MGLVTDGRPSKLPSVLEKREELIELAKQGASKTELYVAMGITKGCAGRWCDSGDDRFQSKFVDLIDELTTYAQADWEKLGRTCLTMDKFQAAVYNKQMAGRFPNDWRENNKQEDRTPVIINVNKSFPNED